MRRIPTWLVLMLAAVGLLLVIPGLWVFVSVTATPLYPNPEAGAGANLRTSRAACRSRRITDRPQPKDRVLLESQSWRLEWLYVHQAVAYELWRMGIPI